MSSKYASFMDELQSHFPRLSEGKLTDISDYNVLWSLDEYISAGHVSFNTDRKELYRLSILIESYAARNNMPLLATFETEKRYKYVEDRYVDLLEKIPKAWIVANFDNPYLAPKTSENAQVISCDGTSISDMWIVATKGKNGPFGLVAEDIGDGMYRGFFTISPQIMQKSIDLINQMLRVDITL